MRVGERAGLVCYMRLVVMVAGAGGGSCSTCDKIPLLEALALLQRLFSTPLHSPYH